MRKLYKFIPMLIGVFLLMAIPFNLSGQISSLPFSENWDTDQAPPGWSYFTNSTEGTVEVQNSTAYSPDWAVEFNNSSDETSDYFLLAPRTNLDPDGTRMSFFAKASGAFPAQEIKIGVVTDSTDPAGTYTNLDNFDLTTSFEQYIVDMSPAGFVSGDYFIAITMNWDGTNKTAHVDDFLWEETPTGPILDYDPDSIDFGMVFDGDTSSVETVSLSNYGINTLSVTDVSITGADAVDYFIEEMSATLPFDLTTNSGNELTVDVRFGPQTTATGLKTASLDITHSEGLTSIPLTGECPEGLIQIGYGTETDTHLPMEPFYGYSYSQSIYLQSEIDVADQRISRVYYQKTNNDEWPDAGQINLYMGHTTQTSLTDWVPVSGLQEVHYEEALPAGDEEGWIEFVLTTPFIYNNTDNLVIAFDENKPSYDGTSDDFYNHTVTEDMSIRYYSDGTNPDPASPPSGTLEQYRPNIRLYFEDLPTTAVFSVNPESHDYGTIIVLASASKDFTVQNTGIGTLTINDIYLGGDNPGEFALSGLPTFPLDITNDQADAFDITADYLPTYDGDANAIIYFDTSEGLDSVMLSGNGYDATISEVPWEEGFDDPSTTTVPDLTLGWSSILNASNTYARIETEDMDENSAPNSVEMYNSSETDGDFYLITPPCTVDPNAAKLRFYADGEVEDSVIVGVMTDNTDLSTFIPVAEFALTDAYEEFEGYLSSAGVSAPYYIAFKAVFSNTYNYINIDDVALDPVPATATPVLSSDMWDAGQRPVGYTATSDTYTLENIGQTNLTVSSVTDLSGTPFSTTFVAGDVDLPLDGDYEFSFEFTPTATGTYEEEFIIETNGGNDTITLTGTSDYTLPGDVVEIGWANDDTTSTPRLPMEATSLYSYSQSIYLQSEIDMDGQAIQDLKYHQLNNTAMPEDVVIYMGHTDQTTLENDWYPVNEMIEVYNGSFPTPDAENWVSISLDIPFVYNNADNLIIAFVDNSDNSYTLDEGFYASNVNEDMSRITTSSISAIDPETISTATVKSTRPNVRLGFGALPTNPILNLNNHAWDAGHAPVNMSTGSGDMFTISNIGGGTLTVSSITDITGTDFSTSFVAGDVSLDAGQEYTFSFTYTPSDIGTDEDTVIIETNAGNDTIVLSGHADYELPENMVEIGTGTETNTHLPMEPYYGYSYSQSIYLQNEINMTDMRISKVLYHKNNSDVWEDAGQIDLYIGHTTQDNLTDWIPLAELQHVHYEEALPAGDSEGWVEFVLTTPFIYNNSDNIVIAFDENTPSYDNSTDEFYNHTVETDMSIRYYADGTNPDPASPPSGTLEQYRPNVRLQFEVLPTEPIFSVNPEMHDYGTIIVADTASESFMVQNTGIDTLTINDIYIGGDDAVQFSIENLPTFPVEMTNAQADALDLICNYHPNAGGAMSATVYFDHSEGLDSIMLSGAGLDATITAIPWDEYFDDPATTTVPEITLGWSSILNSSSSFASIETEAASTMSDPNSVEFYNSSDTDGDFYLITPPATLDPAGTRVRFYADGDTGNDLVVGILTNSSDPSTFQPIDTFAMSGSYVEYSTDLSSVTPAGVYYVGFKADWGNTYDYINIDNVIWEELPTTPVFSALPDPVEFATEAIGSASAAQTVTVRNTGIGNLIIDTAEIIGTDASDFSLSIIDALPDTITNAYDDNMLVEVTFTPTDAGLRTADIQFTDADANTYLVNLIGEGMDATMYPDTLVTFDDGEIPPPFWSEAEALLEDPITLEGTSSLWTSDDFANNTSNTQSAKLNIYSTTRDEWLITSPIDLGDGINPVKLEFDLALTDYYNNAPPDLDGDDDKFAVVISEDGGATWEEAGILRMWDNQGSEYVYNDIPMDGEHVEIMLTGYTGLVKIALYGESTESNADNDLFVDNFELNVMTPDEIALNEAIDSTTVTPDPESISWVEGDDQERVVDYTVNYPTPFHDSLDTDLLSDYMLEMENPLPTGVTVDVEIDGTNIGQIVSDGIDTSYWISDVSGLARPALNTKLDEVITLKVNGLVDIGVYPMKISAITAYDTEFDDPVTSILLGEGTSILNVTPVPDVLPIDETFETGIPASWTTEYNGTDDAEWTFMDDGELGSTTGDDGYMKIDDGAAGFSAITNADLITNGIDMSSNTNGTIFLEFEHYYNNFTSDSATVMISNDGGLTWEQIEMFSNNVGTSSDPVSESYDITSQAAGHNNVKVRWNYNDAEVNANSWSVDDVHIYEYIPNSEAEILVFMIPDQLSSQISSEDATVDVVMPYGYDLTALTPEFVLSEGATAYFGVTEQESGVTTNNFQGSDSNPLIYTVIAEDDETTKDWEISVSTDTEIGMADGFKFSVYPNPNNGVFDLNVNSEDGFTYEIISADGKVISNASVKESGLINKRVDIGTIAPGIYTLKIVSGSETRMEKLIIE
ncbi:MAG: choice-of-anchor D domain-containing protein [Bacteroidales bacterium]